MSALWAALSLQAGPNAALACVGAALLGAAAGASGTFLTLRRQALMADAMAHATLAGLALAFLVQTAFGGDGRFLPALMAGAGATALLGAWGAARLSRRLPEDAAMGVVLSSAYGLGIVLMTLVQGLGAGHPAGLERMLLGSVAGMLRSDALVIALGGALVLAGLWALRRPLALVAFDPVQASVLGLDTRKIDGALIGLVLVVLLIGLNVVGLILSVALLVIPALCARLWVGRVGLVAALAALIGAFCGYVGVALSVVIEGMPSGALIVLIASALFAVSLAVRGQGQGKRAGAERSAHG